VTVLGRLALLVDGRRPPGVYRVDTGALASTLAASLRARGLASWVLDTADVCDKARFLDRCAADLRLPAWFGHNWDALTDALRDLSSPAVVLWHGADALDDDVRSTALEIFAERAAQPPPFTVVLLGAAPPHVTPL
jgi:Barstar (barnase inhibitor)